MSQDEAVINTSSHYLNSELSLEARGALGWFLSYQATSLAVFRNVNGIGRDKARRIINELVEAGYMIRKQINNEEGLFEWEIYVSPFPFPEDEPLPDEPSTDNQSVESSSPPTPPLSSELDFEEEKIVSLPPPIVPPLLEQYPVPESLQAEKFYEVWEKWVKYRKEIRHALKPTTIRMQLRNLGKVPLPVAIAMLEKSMFNGWQGIFELPKDDPAWQEKGQTISDEEFMKQFE